MEVTAVPPIGVNQCARPWSLSPLFSVVSDLDHFAVLRLWAGYSLPPWPSMGLDRRIHCIACEGYNYSDSEGRNGVVDQLQSTGAVLGEEIGAVFSPARSGPPDEDDEKTSSSLSTLEASSSGLPPSLPPSLTPSPVYLPPSLPGVHFEGL